MNQKSLKKSPGSISTNDNTKSIIFPVHKRTGNSTYIQGETTFNSQYIKDSQISMNKDSPERYIKRAETIYKVLPIRENNKYSKMSNNNTNNKNNNNNNRQDISNNEKIISNYEDIIENKNKEIQKSKVFNATLIEKINGLKLEKEIKENLMENLSNKDTQISQMNTYLKQILDEVNMLKMIKSNSNNLEKGLDNIPTTNPSSIQNTGRQLSSSRSQKVKTKFSNSNASPLKTQNLTKYTSPTRGLPNNAKLIESSKMIVMPTYLSPSNNKLSIDGNNKKKQVNIDYFGSESPNKITKYEDVEPTINNDFTKTSILAARFNRAKVFKSSPNVLYKFNDGMQEGENITQNNKHKGNNSLSNSGISLENQMREFIRKFDRVCNNYKKANTMLYNQSLDLVTKIKSHIRPNKIRDITSENKDKTNSNNNDNQGMLEKEIVE